ncbi:MAG: sugar phosphate isomerase/epimerase [Burkholderiaceae bacterium]|nr:sugar phosphate isomerase/epimerase [Microbacteriaceae bacterium]
MLRRTRELGVDLFQVCDYAPLASFPDARLRDIRSLAGDLGVALELGTRGIRPAHLDAQLRTAGLLGATLVRSMTATADDKPTLCEADVALREALPAWEAAGVTLALETYEQISSRDLVALVETVASESLGICLDPANTVAALENPVDVIDRCAPWVRNIHMKDFAFIRRDGWVGFALEGAELGTGLLDYAHLMRTVDPEPRGINRIIEHWLPWQGDFAETARVENLWNQRNIDYLRSA